MNSKNVYYSVMICLFCLLVHAAFVVDVSRKVAPTELEPGMIVSGLAVWEYGAFDLFQVSPPIVKLVAAAPVVWAGFDANWSRYYAGPGARPQYAMGEDFIAANGDRSCELIAYARHSLLIFTLLGAVTVGLWSAEIWGTPWAAVPPVVAWCFDPAIIANASIVTTDVPAAATGLCAAYSFWRWCRRLSVLRAVSAGAFLGVACMTKFVWLPFVVVWPMLAVVLRESHRRCEGLAQLCVMLLVAYSVMISSYLLTDVGCQLDQLQFVSRLLSGRSEGFGNRFSGTVIGRLPVPLPRDLVLGVDSQSRDFEAYDTDNYLRGNWTPKSVWWFYLYAFMVKTPLPLICMLLFSVVVLCCGTNGGQRFVELLSPRSMDLWVLIVSSFILACLVSCQTELSSYRYALPAIVLLFPLLGGLVVEDRLQSVRWRCVVGGGMAWLVVCTLSSHPMQLSYFNELVGGPMGGHRHLLGSNLDWGQEVCGIRDTYDQLEIGEQVSFHVMQTGSHKAMGLVMSGVPFVNVLAEPPESEKLHHDGAAVLYASFHMLTYPEVRERYAKYLSRFHSMRQVTPCSVVLYRDRQLSRTLEKEAP